MRMTTLVCSLLGGLALALTISGCDEKDEPVDTGASSAPDEEGGEEEESGDPTTGAATTPMTAGTGGETGITIPPECQALCDCIGAAGGDPLSCGMACGSAIVDEDPDDRAQCLFYLESTMYSDCNPQCESFAGGG